MASKAAQKRLTKEYAGMQKEPPPFIWAVPDERNILNWNYIIRGPPDSPFAGGEYHGVLMFPSEYPFKPPGIKMLTPSGRFSPDKKICFSMSDFHPGTWNPAWSVATILTGLLSFMLSDEMTTGSVTSSDSHKRVFAARSHEWNLKQARFREAFPDYCTPSSRDLPNMGQQPGGDSKTTDPKSCLLPPVPPLPTTSSGQVPLLASNASAAAASFASNTGNHHDSSSQPNKLTRKTEETSNANGAAGAWTQLVWDKWRWGLLIALAVVVSRLTSSRV
ncbi:UBC-like protein [Dendrothele bispora CBS 962.96]|uniref:Ubiquitin-conjugating enzyme E2 6 n=1 Tax=Dendrothele bispora (strain CBS 962.96) TaxID=1314807 RepID=A0A4S8LNQ1_DENBC|nr:UBC-like protein [Dendrothele bispora CBS 962.96]